LEEIERQVKLRMGESSDLPTPGAA
jgi:hypothetical protein